MTLQEMIDAVKTNLGNRQTGTIGAQSVATVVLTGINSGLNQVLLKYNPDYYNRIVSLDILADTREYTFPVVDTDGVSIRVKDILSFRCYRSDGTEVMLSQDEWNTFVRKTQDYNQETEGTPSFFALHTTKLYLDCVPDEALTLEMFIESYHVKLTTDDLNAELPIEAEWEVMIESFATSHVYHKMQQLQMAGSWAQKYEQQKSEVPGSVRKKQAKGLRQGNSGASYVSDPINDPFVRRYN